MVTLLTITSLALAQSTLGEDDFPALNAQLFRPTVDGRSTLWADDARLEPGGYTSARILLSYAKDPLVYTYTFGDTSERVALVSDVVQTDLMVGHTRGRVRYGAYVPLYLRTTGDLTAGETGLGDMAIDVKGSLLDGEEAPLGLAVSARLVLPTATTKIPLGGRGLGYEVGLVADKSLSERTLIVANLGTRGLPEVALSNVEWDDQLYLRLGLGYALTEHEGLSLEFASHFTYASVGNRAAMPVEALVGGYHRLNVDERLTLRGGLGTGLTDAIGAPQLRAVVALSFEPPIDQDSDLDGLLDSVDRCPQTPEDMDQYQDDDGCPESTVVSFIFVDEDGQLIRSPSLTLADEVGERSGNTRKLEPGTYSFVAEAEDFWPLEDVFEVLGGPPMEVTRTLKVIRGTVSVKVVDPTGVPIPGARWAVDNADMGSLETGVGKAEVKPGDYTVSATATGYLKTSQKVTVVSGETIEVTLSPRPSTVVIRVKKIELGDSIYFETNKAIIKPESFRLLDDVATVMQEYPEITLVRIEGHTDSRGSSASNQQLSEARAQAVRDYLIAQGVAAERLEALGFGESQPLVEGNDEAAWSRNRRVDFFIKERAGEAEE